MSRTEGASFSEVAAGAGRELQVHAPASKLLLRVRMIFLMPQTQERIPGKRGSFVGLPEHTQAVVLLASLRGFNRPCEHINPERLKPLLVVGSVCPDRRRSGGDDAEPTRHIRSRARKAGIVGTLSPGAEERNGSYTFMSVRDQLIAVQQLRCRPSADELRAARSQRLSGEVSWCSPQAGQ
jgi:hypothetical protein